MWVDLFDLFLFFTEFLNEFHSIFDDDSRTLVEMLRPIKNLLRGSEVNNEN